MQTSLHTVAEVIVLDLAKSLPTGTAQPHDWRFVWDQRPIRSPAALLYGCGWGKSEKGDQAMGIATVTELSGQHASDWPCLPAYSLFAGRGSAETRKSRHSCRSGT